MSKLTPHIPIDQGNNQEVQNSVSELNTSSKSSFLKLGLNVFKHTKTGLYHDDNEDSSLFDQDAGFYAVADGVGGGARGDVASSTLLDFLLEKTIEYYKRDNDVLFDDYIIDIVKQSDNAVKEALTALGNARGASTLVSAWLKPLDNGGYSAHYTNVGDARIYLLNKVDNKITVNQLTTDQTYENMGLMHKLPDRGSADDPIRMIGVGAVGNPEVEHIDINANQGLLFCSDGLHKFVDDATIETICTEYLCAPKDQNINVDAICHTLVEKAIKNKSHDDVTALIVWLNTDDSTALKTNKFNNSHVSIKTPSLISPPPNELNNKDIKSFEIPPSKTRKPLSQLFKFIPMLLVLVTVGLIFIEFNNSDNQQTTLVANNDDENHDKGDTNQPLTSSSPLQNDTNNADGGHQEDVIEQELFLVNKGGKYGFNNVQGEVMIPPQYDYAGLFSEGLANVKKDEKWGYINGQGKVVIPLQYNNAYPFSESLANVNKDEKWGYINRQGKVVIPLQYNNAYPFSENLANVNKDEKWGYINKNGEVVIPFEYDQAESFNEGTAAVRKNGKYGFINNLNEVEILFMYDNAQSFKDGRAYVKKDNQWSYINSENEVVNP